MEEDEAARNKHSENSATMKSAVDTNVTEIAETLVKLYILNYLDVDDEGEKRIVEVAVSELQYIVTHLKNRWKNINYVNFLTQTVVIQLTKHFESQQLYFSNQDKNNTFITFSHLRDEESEEVYIRRLAGLVTRYLLPAQYERSGLSRILAQDILSNLIILPIINKITDPHFINLQCIAILKRENIERFSLESSPSEKTEDSRDKMFSPEPLQDAEADGRTLQSDEPSGSSLLKENTEFPDCPGLSVDAHCLSQVAEATTTSCQPKLDDSFHENSENISLNAILQSPIKRKYLSDFLDLQGSAPLLSLWEEIEDLKCCENHLIHNIGTKIFSTYLRRPDPGLPTLERRIMERLETFLIGQPGSCGTGADHEVFFEIQSEILDQIKNNFFSDFCRSHFYLDMMEDPEGHGTDQVKSCPENVLETKLGAIDDQIENKIQAQKALMASLEPESQILKAIKEEIAELRSLRSSVSLHSQQTECWTENLGMWRSRVVDVTQTEKVKSDRKI